MPYVIGLSVKWMAGLLFLIPIGVLIGGVAFAIAWGGRRAGMVFGVLALASGPCGLWALLLWTPHLWWIAMVPVGIGAAALRLVSPRRSGHGTPAAVRSARVIRPDPAHRRDLWGRQLAASANAARGGSRRAA